ncbi:MAG: hypothetical protein U0625_00340 [Phycisphaerales bacterium]
MHGRTGSKFTLAMKARSSACALAVALLAVAPLAAGCNGGRAGRALPSEGPNATWRWRAVRMELSGLTTPLPGTGEHRSAIDARLGFFDADGDETKAVGVLTVRATLGDAVLDEETVDLAADEAHSHTWDGVTETYTVMLRFKEEPPPGRVVMVHANFVGADGSRMSGSREVRWPEPRK